MAAITFFQSFKEALPEKVHNLGSDQLAIALTASANAPDPSGHTQLSDLTQIAYTNLSSRNVTRTSSQQSAGTYTLVLQDLVLTASGGSVAPFRYVVLYNDTATNDELIGYWDYGTNLTLANGETLTINFDASTITLT